MEIPRDSFEGYLFVLPCWGLLDFSFLGELHQFSLGSKLHVAVNGKFDYDGGSGDAHDQSRCWRNVLYLSTFVGVGQVLRS